MINDLLKNPLIRIIGVMLIIYFALFDNKQSPNSLGNRLNPEVVKKDLNEVQQKSRFILNNIRIAQNNQVGAQNKTEEPSPATTLATFQDVNIGDGDEIVKCGANAVISYRVVNQQGNLIERNFEEKLAIGKKTNWLIEENIIGMKRGGTRIIKLPKSFATSDEKIIKLLNSSDSDLEYHITLLDFSNAVDAEESACNNAS